MTDRKLSATHSTLLTHFVFIIAPDTETDSSSKCLSCQAFRQVSHGAAVIIFPWIFQFSLACVDLNILTKCSLIWTSLFMFSPPQRETYKSRFDEIACVSYQAIQTHTCPNCSITRGPCSHRRCRIHCSLCLQDLELHYTLFLTSDTKHHVYKFHLISYRLYYTF